MATYVLVHGAWHGAWCWERLTPELARRGHETVALDLPHDGDFAEHVSAIEDAIPAGLNDVVLVGHSIAGLFLPGVTRQVKHAVYLCGMLAAPGESMRELTAREKVFAAGWPELAARQIVGADRSTRWPSDAAKEAFYQDCDEETAQACADRLRAQFWRFQKESNRLEAYPATPATYVLCRDDRVISEEWSRRAARERLGVDPVELDGGHSPFVSRPGELAEILDTVAR